MPHGLEYVVRPFQQPGSLGNVVIPGTPERTQDKAHITWGGVGTMPSTKLLNPSTIVNTKKEDLTEQDRDSDIERIPIQGSEDDSYVEVARAKKVRLNKEETDADQNISSNYYRAGGTFDPKLDPYLQNFASQATNFPKQSGPIAVTWNMKNQ